MASRGDRLVTSLALVTVVCVYATILVGAYVRASGFGLGCSSWPSCEPDRFFPDPAKAAAVAEWAHRTVAFLAGLSILATFLAAVKFRRSDRALLLAATLAFFLLPVQAGLGAITVLYHLAPAFTAMHTGVAAALFGAVVATAIFAHLGGKRPASVSGGARADAREGAEEPRETRPLKASARDYALLMKPGILFLVVLTGLAGLLLAAGPKLSPWTAAFTLAGGALSAGAANALNHWLERDTDAVMDRTRKRPLPSHRLGEERAFALAATMALASFILLTLLVNLLAAVLALGALFFYVAVYTLWLKKATPQNIVIGGAAGSFPALVGWAAVTGDVGVPALLLGGLIFLWTPPHFWALALIYKDDYARGGFPMMPVVRGEEHTRKEIWWYTLLLVGASLLFYWPLAVLGEVYLFAAIVLGGLFAWYALRLLRDPTTARARKVFTYSIWYLMALFAAIGVDAVLL